MIEVIHPILGLWLINSFCRNQRQSDFRTVHLDFRVDLCLYWKTANVLQMSLSIGMGA